MARRVVEGGADDGRGEGRRGTRRDARAGSPAGSAITWSTSCASQRRGGASARNFGLAIAETVLECFTSGRLPQLTPGQPDGTYL